MVRSAFVRSALVLAFGVSAAACASDKKAVSSGTPAETQTPVSYYPGCENAGDAGVMPATSADGGAASPSITDEQSLFDEGVVPALASCRPCHVPGGTADTDQGRGFLLATDRSGDKDALRSSWAGLGATVDDSPILAKGCGTAADGHAGGGAWPKGSASYEDVKALLTCWSDPSKCGAAIGALPRGKEYPLLGDLEATGGRNYAAVYCENKPDCATLPEDPRVMISGENLDNQSYAVYFNDPFEVCETDALFRNQKRGNDLLVAAGKEPAYTAKPRPKNCGEWRAAVKHGREFILTNAITGPVLTVNSLVNIGAYLGLPLSGDVDSVNAALEQLSTSRYGWPKSPYRNPAPLPGEDPNATDGGSVQLPVATVQVKDADGKWTGKLGNTCFSCHQGMIGQGEVVGGSASWDGHPEIYGGSPNGLFVGMGGSNTDVGTALWDVDSANGLTGPDSFDAVLSNPSWMTNRTRGTNGADQEILSIIFTRNLDTLDFLGPKYTPQGGGKDIKSLTGFGGGDQDVPSWWWQHNKTRYLWVGYGSAGSWREAFFPAGITNQEGHWQKHREADFQDQDAWLNSLEAPKFVGPAVDTALAEQGAVLFHLKDLWADAKNADIPRPPGGNGSCASCHGAYSPRYIHQPRFLPDARLAGTSGYTVPLDILGTDPAQDSLYAFSGKRGDASGVGGSMFIGHPDSVEGYRMPEERAPGEGPFAKGSEPSGWACALGTLGGYVAQPLHGVWASAPYFHNGSIPTVWDVLDPDHRPNVWRRQRVPESEAMPKLGYRGFDVRLDRAYDYQKLGWKYEVLTCDPSSSATYYTSCEKDHDLSATAAPDKNGIVDDRTIYNTNAYSKGNQGHAWTKVLTDDERKALVEYLKTL
ncbi:MAG TPA: hypothetical protein VHE30_17125 [Polyangiaceae bacterium]|nr:hypothetical protein [Polyangiaceae bacterium]